MTPHLIILGAPGSGKGTQAAKLTEKGYKHISTGDLLRSEIAKSSELGKLVSSVMSRGELVDDDMVMALLKANCDLDKTSYIFDGFPRNIIQAKMLDKDLLRGRDTRTVYFKINLDQLLERVVNRRVCEFCGEIYNLISKAPKLTDVCDKCRSVGTIKQRKDDTSDVVANRLRIFTETVDPMLEFYDKKGILVTIDASKEEDQVYKILEKAID